MADTHTLVLARDPDTREPLLTLNLGEPTPTIDGLDQYLDGGDLASSGGNLYLVIDGKEYGSLFFQHDPKTGNAVVTLGAYNPNAMDWEPNAELRGPVEDEDGAE